MAKTTGAAQRVAAESTVALERNPGMPLDLGWVTRSRSTAARWSAAPRRMVARRTVKKEWQAAWLLRAITCIDLTTLAGDDTPGRVRRLCAKARRPVRDDLLEALGVGRSRHPRRRGLRLPQRSCRRRSRRSQGSGIPVAAVSTGFPGRADPAAQKLAEIDASVAAGAEEIDIVISPRPRPHRRTGRRSTTRCATSATPAATAHMKTILATGELATLRNVGTASLVCMMAGADFIKTSTGKESVNATLPVSLVMVRAIRDYHERTGYKVGFKPAGGIRTAKQALGLAGPDERGAGRRLAAPRLFRIGAVGLLADIERQLEHHVARYAAAYGQPMV